MMNEPKPKKLFQCVHCHGIGEPKYLKRHIPVCRYCNSTGLRKTQEAESVPHWFTGEKTPRDNWITYSHHA